MEIIINVGFGEPTLGLWCPKCLKPSGYEQQAYWLQTTGVSPLVKLRKCNDCEAEL